MHLVRGRRHDAFRQQWPDSQPGAMLGSRHVGLAPCWARALSPQKCIHAPMCIHTPRFKVSDALQVNSAMQSRSIKVNQGPSEATVARTSK